jgi:hydroxymethylglutaryl-CoA synthase
MAQDGKKLAIDSLADFYLFHSPYTKLVQKSFARLAFNDFYRQKDNSDTPELAWIAALSHKETLGNRDVEKVFVTQTKKSFESMVGPGLTMPKMLGNTYCASLYSSLVSLVATVSSDELVFTLHLTFFRWENEPFCSLMDPASQAPCSPSKSSALPKP